MRTAPLLLVAAILIGGAAAFFNAPKFELNLDLPPAQRWRGAVTAVVNAHTFDYSFGPVLFEYIPQLFVLPAGTAETLDNIISTRYPEHYAELTGIAAEMAVYGANFPMKYWSSFVYLYELGHITSLSALRKSTSRACTGILSLPADRSQAILHGRNMDEHPAQGRNMTLHINVTRGGVTLYEVFDWTWVTTGFLTSSRMNGVTLEENWRENTGTSVSELLARLTNPNTIPTQFVQRMVQDQAMDFDAAVQFIRSAPLGSETYFIVSGMGRQGAVLSTSPNISQTNVAILNDSSAVPYMVQTNYDRWLPDPPQDPRRTAAERSLQMEGVSRSGTDMGVWMALSVWPVHNPTTMYSVLMSPTRRLEGYIREQMQPDGWNPYPYPE